MLGGGFPPLPPDQGGGTQIDGSYTGRTLPTYMDMNGNHGELVILKLALVSGDAPDNPFLLRKSIEQHISGMIEGAFPEARSTTYALKVRNKKQVDKLLEMTELLDGTKIKIEKHPYLNFVRCVINAQGLENLTDEECLKFLADQKVTYLRRIKRKVDGKEQNTPTIILTIDGTTRPDHIDIGYQRCRTRPYYPPPMLCFKCYRFGHTKARCPEKQETCGHCAQQHDIVKGILCMDPAYCPRCKSNGHSVSSRQCPVYIEEDAIQHIRVDKGLSYAAAKRVYTAAAKKNSFANVTVASKDQIISELSAKVEFLIKDGAEKDKKIQALESSSQTDPHEASTSKEVQELKKAFSELRLQLDKRDQQVSKLLDALNRKREEMDEQNKRYRYELQKRDEKIKALEKALKKEKAQETARIQETKNTIDDTPIPSQRVTRQSERLRLAVPISKQEPEALVSLSLSSQASQSSTKKKPASKQPHNELDPKRSKTTHVTETDDSAEEMEQDNSPRTIDLDISLEEEEKAHDDSLMDT